MNLVRLWESRNLNMYTYRCLQLYLVPIPYDPMSVYMCKYVCVCICTCINIRIRV